MFNTNFSQTNGVNDMNGFLDVTDNSQCFFSDCRLFGENINNNNNSSNPQQSRPTRDPKAITEAEKVITQELYEMSMQERENALQDIHGVSDEIQEVPEFIFSRLNELEIELQRPRFSLGTTTDGNSTSCEAFYIAMGQNPAYVRGMYLMFLRCELFDVTLAAERMMRHFDMKRTLFGNDKLGRDIYLSDLSKADRECLESGFLQWLPQRDRAGRVIFFKTWYNQTYKERENVWRSIWYLDMTILRDELTQKKGKISVLYNVHPNWIKTFDRELFKGVGKLKKATPLRTVAAHYCFSDPAFGAIIKFVSMVMDRHTRTRTRLHQGTHVETQYELMSFGIPMSAIPLSSDGTMRRKDHVKWIKTRQKHEAWIQQSLSGNNPAASMLVKNIVLIPSQLDVLFGRGKVYQMHFGNMNLGEALEEEGRKYFAAAREEKAGISYDIVFRMKKQGARFLRQDDDGLWIEVDDKTAADKVGHGFRNRKQTTLSSSATAAATATSTKTATTATTKIRKPSNDTRTDEVVENNNAASALPPSSVREYLSAKRFRFSDEKEELSPSRF